MRSLLWALGMGLVGAGLVHIVIVLLVPLYADHNSWTRVAALGPENQFHMLDQGGTTDQRRETDPLFLRAACPFDLDNGPVRVVATGIVPFWSLSVFGHNGENIYSINDRSSIDRRLDLVLAQPLQRIEMEKNSAQQKTDSIVAEVDARKGFVVVRGFVPDDSWRPIVAAFLAKASCAAMEP